MPNQYTNGRQALDEVRTAKVKFTVLLTTDQREDLLWLGNHFEMDGSAIFRECIEFLLERLREYKDHYPNLTNYPMRTVIKAYYDAGQERMAEERAKENALMEQYQQARLRDGGKVNFDMDYLALAFYVRAWQSGRSAAEVLEEFAKQKAELGKRYGIDWHDDPWLRNFMKLGQADPEASNQAASPEPTPDDLGISDATMKRVLALLAVALGVGVALGIAGSWAWLMYR
jgi:hypothetical protein